MLAGVGLAISVTATWYLSLMSQRVQRRFRDRVAIALESHVAQLQASVPTIEHHERPEYLDRLAMLRDQVFALDHMFMSLFSTLGWLFRLAITGLLLASIDPALVLLLFAALPAFWTSTWRPAVERRVRNRSSNARLARHMFVLGTTAPPQGGARHQHRRLAGHRATGRLAAMVRPGRQVRWASAAWHGLAWAVLPAPMSAPCVRGHWARSRRR
jgi:ATP-binding cassette subfamily B protein